MLAYHDSEWGRPLHGEVELFERLTLEAFQSGLSWRTILNKRENFRKAFDGFDPDRVAAYGADEVARLMADAGIVRNRKKIDAAITNARRPRAPRRRRVAGRADLVLRPRPAAGPEDRPRPRLRRHDESKALAKELKRRGLRVRRARPRSTR